MTNILLEQSDHEDNANNNSEEGETIKCQYVGIFSTIWNTGGLNMVMMLHTASYYSMFTLCWATQVSRGINMVILQQQEKLS
jgi:hypothetical protein